MTGAHRPQDPQRTLQILDATAALLADVGYVQLSIEEVARRAGVAKTTIYRRWPSKAQLAAAAVFQNAPALFDPPDSGDLRGDLRRILRSIRDVLMRPGARAALAGLLAEFSHDAALQSRLREGFIFRLRALMGRPLASAMARGEIRTDVPAATTLAAVVGALVFRGAVSGLDLDDDFIEQLLTLVLEGLCP